MNYPTNICHPCGVKHRTYPAKLGAVSTYHIGKCNWCGLDDVPVTEPRDFGYPLMGGDDYVGTSYSI
jgi:hypothetical protein